MSAPLACKVCGEIFSSRNALFRHLRCSPCSESSGLAAPAAPTAEHLILLCGYDAHQFESPSAAFRAADGDAQRANAYFIGMIYDL